MKKFLSLLLCLTCLSLFAESDSVKKYLAAAKAGDAAAQYNLGVCYYNGDGVPKDLTQAAYWFRKSAEQGDADAADEQKFIFHIISSVRISFFPVYEKK